MKRLRVIALRVRAQYLYHVTDKDKLPDIANQGLTTEAPKLSTGGYAVYSEDRIFLTDKDSVDNWAYYVNIKTDSKDQEAILRINTDQLNNIYIDEHGTVEAPSLKPYHLDELSAPTADPTTFSYYVEENIPPDAIEVHTDEGWMPLTAKLRVEANLPVEDIIGE